MSDIVAQYKEHPEQIYPELFFKRMQRPREWQIAIGKMLGTRYDIKSAIDFGCGLGYYLTGLHDNGAKVVGIEFMYKNAINYISPTVKDYIGPGNVMEPIDGVYNKSFDLSMSVEVAEHILPEKSDIFVKNLTDTSNKYVFLTAAPPGQGGDGHINEQVKKYWIDKMEVNGFEYNSVETTAIMKNVHDIRKSLKVRGRYIDVIRNNLMFFVKKENV